MGLWACRRKSFRKCRSPRGEGPAVRPWPVPSDASEKRHACVCAPSRLVNTRVQTACSCWGSWCSGVFPSVCVSEISHDRLLGTNSTRTGNKPSYLSNKPGAVCLSPRRDWESPHVCGKALNSPQICLEMKWNSNKHVTHPHGERVLPRSREQQGPRISKRAVKKGCPGALRHQTERPKL